MFGLYMITFSEHPFTCKYFIVMYSLPCSSHIKCQSYVKYFFSLDQRCLPNKEEIRKNPRTEKAQSYPEANGVVQGKVFIYAAFNANMSGILPLAVGCKFQLSLTSSY